MRVLSTELIAHDGKQVECAGWLRGVRDLNKLIFLLVADRKGILQAVVKEPKLVEQAKKLGLENVITLKGTAKKNEKVKNGAELEVSEIEVLSPSASPLPVDIAGKTKTSFETRFDHRALDLRGEKQQAVFRVQNSLCQAFREYLVEQGFTEIHTPKIIATGTEGGANLFPVIYFGREAFLAQSPQFYKQMLVGAGFERVFELAPVFRAEEHDTPFHLNEYVSLDFEMGFVKDETDVMRMTESAIHAMFERVVKNNQSDLEIMGVKDFAAPKLPIPVVHYWDVQKTIESMGGKFEDPMADLGREDEGALCAWAKEKHGSDFVFVDNYPADKRPAYTMPYEKDPKYTRGYDLLYKGLEIVTGGQRIHNHGALKAAFEKKGYRPEDFEFYFEIFKFGMPPHGGQAIGLERITSKILGLDNVREAAYFPRDKKRLYP